MWRVHRNPEQLPPSSEHPGPHRCDDPRPNADDRYRVRYSATTLRGCLIESMAWLRPNVEAARRLEEVTGDDEGEAVPELSDAVADFLATRRVASCTFAAEARFIDIHDPAALNALDGDLNVEPLLTAPRARAALGDGLHRPHLDQAAVLLAGPLGRDLTQHCSLAIWDLDPPYSGITYRSRHDLIEWCWAAYDRTDVAFAKSVALSADIEEHYMAVRNIAELWRLPLERWTSRWQTPKAES